MHLAWRVSKWSSQKALQGHGGKADQHRAGRKRRRRARARGLLSSLLACGRSTPLVRGMKPTQAPNHTALWLLPIAALASVEQERAGGAPWRHALCLDGSFFSGRRALCPVAAEHADHAPKAPPKEGRHVSAIGEWRGDQEWGHQAPAAGAVRRRGRCSVSLGGPCMQHAAYKRPALCLCWPPGAGTR